MNISFSAKIKKTIPVLFIPLFEDEEFIESGPREMKAELKWRQKIKDFKAKEGETLCLTKDSVNRTQKILFFGMGKKKDLKPVKARQAAARMVRIAGRHEYADVSVYVTESLKPYGQELGEGFVLGNYNVALYQTGKNRTESSKKQVKSVGIISYGKADEFAHAVRTGKRIAEAVNATRDLVSGPNNMVNAETLGEEAKKIAREAGIKCTVLDKKQLEKLGMGAILGVNRGSELQAKLVILEYFPKKAKKMAPVLLVGKGITFDSGGYNLKPTHAISDMKKDMAGAAAVFGVFRLLKALDIQIPVVGIAPLTDNLIGSRAQKVNDIITTYAGKTVEITNTDAEGRLVLADAMAYGIQTYKPSYAVDAATLTGACMVALGDRYAGLFGNDDDLLELIKKAGDETDELVWHLPIHDDFRKRMKGRLADLKNSEDGGLAGASMGALFIEEFVGKTKWAHLDIAGVTWSKDPKSYDPETATGFGVRLLIKTLQKLGEKSENRR